MKKDKGSTTKKEYTTPRLERYGDLHQLTHGNASNMPNDGVNPGPKTKT
jgi:hypothetical protein